MALLTTLSMEQFISEVRGYLRDFAELNQLIAGEETSDRMIQYCVCMAIDEFNTSPPLSAFTVGNFPSRNILVNLTVCHILTSVGILKSRNRLSYSDSGFSVDTETQDDRYARWITLLRTQLNSQIMRLKVALNIQGGYGASLGSEYGWINGWYGIT